MFSVNIIVIISLIFFLWGLILACRSFFSLFSSTAADERNTEERVKKSESELIQLRANLKNKLEESTRKDSRIEQLSTQLEQLIARQKESAGQPEKLEALKTDLKNKADQAKEKDSQIEQLNTQLAQLNVQQKTSAQTLEELENLKSQLKNKAEEIQNKDSLLETLNQQLEQMKNERKEFEEKLAQFKKAESDLIWLENMMNEQKALSRQTKQRLEENRVKQTTLKEKIQESTELIAKFAQGKEFDEFRKSIHMDEIVQKYEDEIKNLKVKNMELEKRLKIED